MIMAIQAAASMFRGDPIRHEFISDDYLVSRNPTTLPATIGTTYYAHWVAVRGLNIPFRDHSMITWLAKWNNSSALFRLCRTSTWEFEKGDFISTWWYDAPVERWSASAETIRPRPSMVLHYTKKNSNAPPPVNVTTGYGAPSHYVYQALCSVKKHRSCNRAIVTCFSQRDVLVS